MDTIQIIKKRDIIQIFLFIGKNEYQHKNDNQDCQASKNSRFKSVSENKAVNTEGTSQNQYIYQNLYRIGIGSRVRPIHFCNFLPVCLGISNII